MGARASRQGLGISSSSSSLCGVCARGSDFEACDVYVFAHARRGIVVEVVPCWFGAGGELARGGLACQERALSVNFSPQQSDSSLPLTSSRMRTSICMSTPDWKIPESECRRSSRRLHQPILDGTNMQLDHWISIHNPKAHPSPRNKHTSHLRLRTPLYKSPRGASCPGASCVRCRFAAAHAFRATSSEVVARKTSTERSFIVHTSCSS